MGPSRKRTDDVERNTCAVWPSTKVKPRGSWLIDRLDGWRASERRGEFGALDRSEHTDMLGAVAITTTHGSIVEGLAGHAASCRRSS
jgi:hypothetical protein